MEGLLNDSFSKSITIFCSSWNCQEEQKKNKLERPSIIHADQNAFACLVYTKRFALLVDMGYH